MRARDHFTLVRERDRCSSSMHSKHLSHRCPNARSNTIKRTYNSTAMAMQARIGLRCWWWWRGETISICFLLVFFWSDIVAFTLHSIRRRIARQCVYVRESVMAKQSSSFPTRNSKKMEIYSKCSRFGQLLRGIIDSKNGICANFSDKQSVYSDARAHALACSTHSVTCALQSFN